MRPILLPSPPGLATTTAVLGSVSLVLSAAAPAAALEAHTPSEAFALRAVTPPPQAFLRAAAALGPADYVVADGDTISAIAARFGLATGDVLAWNGLEWSSLIHPGDELRLSAPVSEGGGASDAPPDAPAAPAAAEAPTHVVAAGDTLWAIAADAGLTLDALLAANGLARDAIIYPGQTLLLVALEPVASTTPAPVEATASAAPAEVAPALAAPVALDDEQIANVRVIIQVGRERGVSDRGITIALATAMVESWIRNLDWGDRDSLGLFQQRPSAGWGSAEEVRDPARAAAAFYGGDLNPNGGRTHGLLDIPGWESLSFADAAQAVQISAYPDRYAAWEQRASSWLAEFG